MKTGSIAKYMFIVAAVALAWTASDVLAQSCQTAGGYRATNVGQYYGHNHGYYGNSYNWPTYNYGTYQPYYNYGYYGRNRYPYQGNWNYRRQNHQQHGGNHRRHDDRK